MTTFLIAFVIFVLALMGLSLGMVLNKRPIKGSCGGLNQIDGVESDCAGACRVRNKASDHPCPKRAAQILAERQAERPSSP